MISAAFLWGMLMMTPADRVSCSVLTDFTDPVSNQRWVTVNDNVMGGRSEGGLQINNGRLVFEGDINTNGGGFSSIRWPLAEDVLDGASAIRVRLKTDGRPYNLNLRTSARVFRRQIAYRGDINIPASEDWSDVTVSFDDLVPTIFGEIVRGAPPFEAADTRTLGFIIADGQDGPFRAEIDQLEVCRTK